MTIEQLTVQDPRLSLNGGGTITLDDRSLANLRFSFVNSSLDPYLKFYAPKMSPYTRIIASGSIGLTGPLADRSQIQVDTTIDETTVTLLDYTLRNEGEVKLSFGGNAFRIGQLHLAGQDTKLEVSGGIDTGQRADQPGRHRRREPRDPAAVLPRVRREWPRHDCGAARRTSRRDVAHGRGGIIDGRLKLHALAAQPERDQRPDHDGRHEHPRRWPPRQDGRRRRHVRRQHHAERLRARTVPAAGHGRARCTCGIRRVCIPP